MHWFCRKQTYNICIPKLEKSIYALNEQEAADYFAWFMQKIPERVAYVSAVCAKDLRISQGKMDCSPESLILLWKWFRRKARTEKYKPEEPGSWGKQIPELAPKRQLTLETEYILRDIGMYLAETLRKNNKRLHWTYYCEPKRDFFVNHPLLQGFIYRGSDKPFPASFEPIHMVGVQASKILSHDSKETDLLTLYTWWAKIS